MTPGAVHHIRHCTFTIGVNDKQKALHWRPRLSDLIKTKLFAVIEQVFSEADTGETIRINSLNIDLGNIDPTDWEQGLEEKLRASLQNSLRQQTHATDAVQARLEKLHYFLLYGCFPWFTDKRDTFESLFEQMMHTHPQQLVALIKASCHHHHVISRIVLQLGQPLLAALIGHMELPFNQFIIDYIADIQQAHHQTPLVKAGAGDFEKTVWKLTLAWLFVNRGSEFNRRSFVKWNIGQIAGRYGMTYEALLFFLAGCLKKAARLSFRDSLMGIIEELASAYNAPGSAPAGAAEDNAGTTDLKSFENFLLHGRLVPARGDYNPSDIFNHLLQNSRMPTRELIEAWGYDEAVQDRIRKELPVSEVVQLVEPEEYPFIAAYASELKRSHLANPVVKASSADFEYVVWKFILQYLMKDRGSDFNRKTFIQSNLAHIAAQYNTTYDRLLHFMLQSLQSLPAPLVNESSLPALFEELAQNIYANDTSLTKEPVSSFTQQVAQHDRLQAFEILLTSGILPWFREEESPEAFLLPLLHEQPTGMHSIVRRLFSSTPPLFYRQLVQQLIDNQPADIEALLHGDSSPATGEHTPYPVEYFKRSLFAFIRGRDTSRETGPGMLRDYMQAHPADCRLFLISLAAAQPDLPVALARITGDDHEQLLYFLQPGSASFLQEYSRWIRQAASSGLVPGGADQQERYRAILLQHLLRPRGRIFNATVFLEETLYELLHIPGGGIPGEEQQNALAQVPGLSAPLASMIRKAIVSAREKYSTAPTGNGQVAKTGSKPPVRRDISEKIFDYLLKGRLAPGIHENTMRDCLRMMMDTYPLLTTRFSRKYGRKKEIRERWLQLLPANLLARLLRGTAIPARAGKKNPPKKTNRREASRLPGLKPGFGLSDPGSDTEPLYIQNAGLVLLHPYFARYFELLGLLHGDEPGKKQFTDPDAACKAVHALQYLVDETTNSPEHALLLNKIICGIPLPEPIAQSAPFADSEKALAESLLKGVLQNWPMLANSSVEALRTFLRREGKLVCRDERWDLEVENKTVDILIDHIPWGIGVVKQDWMKEILYVKWRK